MDLEISPDDLAPLARIDEEALVEVGRTFEDLLAEHADLVGRLPPPAEASGGSAAAAQRAQRGPAPKRRRSRERAGARRRQPPPTPTPIYTPIYIMVTISTP